MTRHPLRALLPLTMALLVAMTAACGGDDDDGPTDPPGGDTDLPGTYELVSLTQGGITVGPPLATGTMSLTETTYTINLTVPNPEDPFGPPDNVVDNGTYSTDGNNWTQESSATGLQGVGTYTLEGTTLTVDVTTAGLEVLTVWNKTG